MITINLNEKNIELADKVTIRDLIMEFNPEADVVIHNGFTANDNDIVCDGDTIVLIKKGIVPSDNELEYMMVARHTPKIYQQLKDASVAIVGLGGLGSNVAVSLTRMGIGKIKIIDYDVVEPSNLNRQFYFVAQIGEKKVNALYHTLKNINPYIEIITCNNKITIDNFTDELKDFTVIIEAVDIAETKAFIFNECVKKLKNSFIIGASGVAGLYDTSMFEIRYVANNGAIVGDFINEAKKGQGLMATRVAVAANIQANIAVRYIIGEL